MDLQDTDILAEASRVAKIGGWRLERHGLQPTWTEETYRIHGVPVHSQITLDTALNFYLPKDRMQIATAVTNCLETGEPFSLEAQIQSADGRLVWALVKGEAVIVGGVVVRLKGIFQDITHQKTLELQREMLMKQFQRVSENSPGLVFQFLQDPGGKSVFKFIGGRAAGSFGIAVEEIKGHPILFFDLVEPADRAPLLAKVDQSLKTMASFEWDGRLIDHTGRTRWVCARAIPERTENGQILWDGLLVETTEVVEARQKLGEFKEFMAAFADAIPAAVFTKDLESRYVMCNSYFDQITKLGAAGSIGKTDAEIFGESFARLCMEADQLVIRTGKAGEFLDSHGQEDGEDKIYRCYKFPVRDSKGRITGVAGVAWDVSEQKKLEKELEVERHKVFQSAKFAELGELAAAMAHEINNPLAIIQGSTQQIRRALQTPDLSRVEYLNAKIEDTGRRIARIVQALRVFARDGHHDNFEVLRVGDLIENVLGLCQEKLRVNGVEVRLFPFDPDLRIYGQATQLIQVFVNLINNSFDAIESLEEKWIHISVERLDQTVSFSVTDSGRGIPEIYRDKVMLPFFTSKPIGKGTGLGLSIAKGIVESHGGRIFLDNAHHNTRFIFEIPPKLEQLQ